MGSVRVLIVDDFAEWRLAARSILAKDPDFEVVGEGHDGLEGVQKCEELQPDVVLLDILLPKIDGFEAARRISKVSPGTRIVFLSSYHSAEMMRETVKMGASFVVKANAGRDLLPVIRAAIQDEIFLKLKYLDDDDPVNPEEA